MQIYYEDDQACLFAPESYVGKTCLEFSPQVSRPARTSGSSLRRLLKYVYPTYMFLDLTPGNSNLLGGYEWEIRSPWAGELPLLNTGVSPKEERESTLSQILEDSPHPKYYLSPKACLGILRRAKVRGKPLPKRLEAALLAQAGLSDGEDIDTDIHAYHINQRNEGIDLHGVAGALMATQNMQMQTFVAGFSPGAGSSAGSVGYTEDVAPTLKSADGGNTTPAVLRLYENHGIDSRYKGPFDVAPTLSARAGTGGNNLPLVDDTPLCIAGNVIDRQPQNGGNGSGVSEDLSYTITATDRHAVFARQRVDVFQEDDVASTQSARQYKDATDLVYDSSKPFAYLIRRLTPLECERLQGFPDGWTDIPGASDSARYKALGNSVAIPCVDYIMHGVAVSLNGL